VRLRPLKSESLPGPSQTVRCLASAPGAAPGRAAAGGGAAAGGCWAPRGLPKPRCRMLCDGLRRSPNVVPRTAVIHPPSTLSQAASVPPNLLSSRRSTSCSAIPIARQRASNPSHRSSSPRQQQRHPQPQQTTQPAASSAAEQRGGRRFRWPLCAFSQLPLHQQRFGAALLFVCQLLVASCQLRCAFRRTGGRNL
jgi:hypothetical protein